MKDALEKLWENNEHRDKMSKLAIKRLKDIDNNFGYSQNRIEYSNTVFKSSWEVEIAKFLDNHNISWQYEPKTFKMDNGHRYTPDFFLEDFNIFIEVKPIYFINEKVIYKIQQVRQNNHKCFLLTEQNKDNLLNYLTKLQ